MPSGDTERWHFLRGVRLGEELLKLGEDDSTSMCALAVGAEHYNVVETYLAMARNHGPQVEAGLCAVLSDLVTSGEKLRPGAYVKYALEAFGVLDGTIQPEPAREVRK